MALPLLPLAIGALAGAGSVFVFNESADKISRAALYAGGAILVYTFRDEIKSILK